MAFKRKYSSKRKTYRKSRRGKFSRKGRQQSFKARVKRVILKTAETKTITIGNEDTQLYHDVGNTAGPSTNQSAILFDPWSYISQGTTYKTRIGDQLMPRGISVKLWMANKQDRPNIIYRIIVVVLARQINGTIPTYNNVDLFKATDVGTNNTTIIAEFDRDKVKKVLYDKLVRNEGLAQSSTGSALFPSANFRGRERHCVKKLWIKAKQQRNIVYNSGTNVHQNNFMALYVIPYDSYSTLQTDNIATVAMFTKLYWKDP